MFVFWKGKVAVRILTGLAQRTQLITGWYNEMWDIEKGTERAGKTDK